MSSISLARPSVASGSRFTFAQVGELLSTRDFAAIRDAFSRHFGERLTNEQLDRKLKSVAVSSFDANGIVDEMKMWKGVNAAFREISAADGKRLGARQANKLINAGIEEHCDVMDRAGKIEARGAEHGLQVRDILAMARMANNEGQMADMAQVERLVRRGFVTSDYDGVGNVSVALTGKFEEEFGKYFNPQAKKAGKQKIVKAEEKPAVAAPKVKKEAIGRIGPVVVARAIVASIVVVIVLFGITILTSVLSPPPVSNAKEDANGQKPAAAAQVAGNAGASAELAHQGIGLHNYHVDKRTGANSYRPVVSFDYVNRGGEIVTIDVASVTFNGKTENAVIIGGPVKVAPGGSERVVLKGPHIDGPVPYGQEKEAVVKLNKGASQVAGNVKCFFRDFGAKDAAKSYAKGRPVSEVLSTPELMLNLVGRKCERQVLALNAAGMMQQDAKLMQLVGQFQKETGARKGKWLLGQIEMHLKNLAKEMHGAL